MLSDSSSIAYLHEPFNVPYGIIRNQFVNWFQYVCAENEHEHIHKIERLIKYDYPLVDQLTKADSMRRRAAVFRDFGYFLTCRFQNKRPLIKDPLALLSTEWLHQRFEMIPVITIRHPAAFCSSLILKDWRFDFRNFQRQKIAMKTILNPFQKEINRCVLTQPSLIDQGIILWNITHTLIMGWQSRYNDWIFVRHEDLSRDPTSEFEVLYNQLSIPFSTKEQDTIKKNSGAHNPSEQTPGQEFVRDSKANIKNWKRRLTDSEIEHIRIGTQNVSAYFYNDNDW
tara:strand:- start:1000 stop:1848 length:849 start_codon:yes stop_codon:yes gene_type:complete